MVSAKDPSASGRTRAMILYGLVFLIGGLFIARLFYLQIIRHDHYVSIANNAQQSAYTIPAKRGLIYAMDGTNRSPLVLNEVLPTLFADQRLIDDPATTAAAIKPIIGGNLKKLENDLSGDSGYVVLAEKLNRKQTQKVRDAQLLGIGLTDVSYRVYPEEDLAAQVLGFVNNDGAGQYGIEESLNEFLAGEDGQLEAVTDINNVPLVSIEDSVIQPAVDGKDLTLTIDINIQRYVEKALAEGVQSSGGKSGSAIVIDPNSGAILAMASYPSFKPADFFKVTDYRRFQNQTVSDPYETGSTVKIFTMAAGLQEGVVKPESTYYDSGFKQVGDREITNAGNSGGVTRSMTDVIQYSVNTGVIHVLEQLGGGSISQSARETFHDYLTKKFGFGSTTGVAQSNESSGLIFDPNTGDGDAVRYANMTFGQGMTATMLQMVSAASSLVNGGDYYQPYLVHSKHESIEEPTLSEPQILRKKVVSKQVSQQIRDMMVQVVQGGGGITAKRDGYEIGGKTGTSQLIDEATGEYSEFRETGSFIGYGGGDQPEFVIMTKVEEPTIGGYAGSVAAAPIFADISNWLIDFLQIPPKSTTGVQ